MEPPGGTCSQNTNSNISQRKTHPVSPNPASADQLSLQDSALSRLIDAVSLGDENHTHGSISALIGQLEMSPEQATDLNPSLRSRPSSTPVRRIEDSRAHPVSSPETLEPATFTILDEQVLSSIMDLPSSHLELKSRRSSLNKTLDQAEDAQVESCGGNRYQDGYRAGTFGGPREFSLNSTISERFLLCHDSTSSSLMEVEINVDGDPLQTTLTSGHNDLQFSNQSLYYNNRSSTSTLRRSTRGAHSTESVVDRPSLPQHRPQWDPGTDRHLSYSNNQMIVFSSSDCLTRTPETSSSRWISAPVVLPKQYSKSCQKNQTLKPAASECYKGIYLVGSPIPKSSSPCKSKSLGDLTSEDISCNFQSRYKIISRSFITPAMHDYRRTSDAANQTPRTDALTAQLRKLVTLDETDPRPHPLPPCPASQLPAPLSRRLSTRSQSRVRHIANRARERQHRPSPAPGGVVLRNKTSSSQNDPINRHSTGSYIAGYMERVEGRGSPDGSGSCFRGYRDQCQDDDFCDRSEPEVYFLLRI